MKQLISLSIALLVLLLSDYALGQEGLPPLNAIVAVSATDAGRLINDMDAIMKQSKALEAKASYWEDACKSTLECGGKQTQVGQK